jgi:hypothetical protein
VSINPTSAGRPDVPDGTPSDVTKYLRIVVTGIVIAVIGVAALLVITEVKDRQPSDLAAMRLYRISQLTDDEIRKMRADAEVEFKKIRQEAAEEGNEFWRKYSQECAKTQSDVAYRVRHPEECHLPLTWQGIGKPLNEMSVEQIFQANILGICNFAFTVRDARKSHCIPP